MVDNKGLKVTQLEYGQRKHSYFCESLFLPSKKMTILGGSSGSGKTSFLEVLAGMKNYSSGNIKLNGIALDSIPIQRRGCGYVPQDLVLFPHLKTKAQLLSGVKFQFGKMTSELLQKYETLIKVFKLETLLDKYPHELSGGEARRVALGRALLISPKYLVLDECFSGLDDRLKEEVIQVVKDYIIKLDIPAILVSHNSAEIEYLADEKYFILDGCIKK